MNPQRPISAARKLAGMILEGGWKVTRLIEPDSDATGGNFSCGYEVESDTGKKAFLKALDYSTAMRSADPAEALRIMTSGYVFERDLLFRCRERGVTRVVTALSSGKVIVDGDAMAGLVEYLIFERAGVAQQQAVLRPMNNQPDVAVHAH